MAEVLTGGPPERPPRRWSRVAAAVAAVLVVGTGAGLVVRVARPAAAPVSTPSPSPSASSGWTASAPAQDLVEPRLDGVPAPAPDGARLVVGGPHPTGVGRGAPWLGRLPVSADEAVSRVLAVPAGLVVAVQRRQLSDTQPSSKIYLVRHTAAVLLAAADEVVVGVAGDRVFTLRYGPSGQGRPGTLLELTLSGRVLARHSVPAGFSPQADTAAGLLVAVYPVTGNGPADLRIVDRHTLAVRQRLGQVAYVAAATSTRAAWISAGCTSRCDLTVADLPNGARRALAVANGYGVGAFAFSPDDRRIAVGYYGRHPQQPGGTAPGFVEVVTLSSGARERVPGVATGIKQVADLAWTPDGQWLAISVGWPDQDIRRVGLWPADGGPVRVLSGRYVGGYPPSALLAL